LFFSSATWSYFTSITSISSAHTASPSSSSWVAVLPNQSRPRNTLRARTGRSLWSIWIHLPGQPLLETLALVQMPQAAAPVSPTLWVSRCRPRSDRTRDRHHPLSNRTWHSPISNAMGYPSACDAVGGIYHIHTDSTRQLTRTHTYIHIYNGFIVHAVFLCPHYYRHLT